MTLGRCAGGDRPSASRPCSATATVLVRGRPLCDSCAERARAARRKRSHDRQRGQRDHAHATGQLCDDGQRGMCLTCSRAGLGPRPVGRPPVVSGEETTELRVRVGASHLRMLDEMVADGYARDRSAATRRAIEEARRG